MSNAADMSYIIPPQQERSTRFLWRVLEAAERILRRDGSEGLTMPAVAQEAGVSVGGIYRRFQAKQALLRAVKDRHMARSEAAMAEAMEAGHGSLDEVVCSFLATLVGDSALETESLFGVIMEPHRDDLVMNTRGQVSEARQRASFALALRPFRHQIAHDDPDAAIDMAFLMAVSVFMRRATGKGATQPIDWPDLRRELARAMIAYLRGPAD